MRILVLNFEFPPVGGGGGQAAADLCRGLSLRGHEVRVITSAAPGLDPSSEIDGYRVRRIRCGRRALDRATFPSMAAYVVGGLGPAIVWCREWKPDLIHAHFAVPTGALAWGVSRWTRIPYVLTAHLGDVPGGVPEKTDRWFRWIRPLTPPIWRGAAAVTAVSEFTRGLARRAYGVPIDVIGNGVDIAHRPPAQPANTPARLVFVGRFQPQKNLLFLVEGLARIRDLPWICRLVGDGPERARVEARIREADLLGRVTLEGWTSPAEAREILASSDVLVMPSLAEGLPVVGVQALGYGLAIVGSRVGGLAELIQDGRNGRSCAAGDLDGFAAALRACVSEKEVLTGMKVESWRLAERFDLSTVVERYEAVFRRVIERAGG